MKKVVETKFPNEPILRTPAQLGEAVRAARTKTKMTLVEAAMTLGIAKQTLSDLERGKPTVGLGIALTVAAELGVTLFMVPSELKNQTHFILTEAGLIRNQTK